MSASVFTQYTSSDASGPGLLVGTAGSLLTLLDACLVNGYTGKTAAGWTKTYASAPSTPVANSGNLGVYRSGSNANNGLGFGLVVNDNGYNATSTYKEALATGWEQAASIAAPVGTGVGQFPTTAQGDTTSTKGNVVIRKSADLTTGRAWRLFADQYTAYLFVTTGDNTGLGMMAFFFGDVFSLQPGIDSFRCMIAGRTAENSALGGGIEYSDFMSSFGTASAGHYMARTWAANGTSIAITKTGAMALTGAAAASVAFAGVMGGANPVDNSWYISPCWITEPGASVVRGRCRGMYHIAHAATAVGDGQLIQGSGYLSGKTIQVVKGGPNSGYWGIEVSATVETN